MVILALIALGLCLGSFVNALVWRLRQQDGLKTKQARSKYSVSTGRSMCTHCKHLLAPSDLVPVLSWVWLRGKCRYCHKPIQDTPATELITPVLFVFSYLYWPFAFSLQGKVNFGFWLVYLVGFVALAAYDFKWFELPDKIVFSLSGIFAAQTVLHVIWTGSLGVLPGILWGALIGGGIFWVLLQISDKLIGGGDVKLGFLIGAIVGGPVHSLLIIFIASLLGTVVALPLMVVGKAKLTTRLPFGPYLLAATIIVQLFGLSLVAWYKRQVGL